MNRYQVREKLEAIGEEDLLAHWELLSSNQQEQLLRQIETLDVNRLNEQRQLLLKSTANESFEPFRDYSKAGVQEDINLGTKLLKEGKVGCLVLAGGQGSRLGFEGPKGMYPISVIKHKSLFQILAEKVAAASSAFNHPLNMAIMTSPQNDLATRSFFVQNHYFGLNPGQVSFFKQGTLPFLDSNGKMFLEDIGTIAEGPDGNGYVLHRLYAAGIFNEWKKKGVSYVNCVLVDNPLADPFDAELVGYQSRINSEVAVKGILREDPTENVGVLVKKNGSLRVVEYSEIPTEERMARLPDGSLKHPCANISLFSFTLDFIAKLSRDGYMPLHKAYKSAKKLGDATGSFYAWKFEAYIFDVLRWADRIGVLVYPRELCFSPLKQPEGASSPETVRESLLKRDQEIIHALTGSGVPKHPFELSADFHYPSQELIKSIKGKKIPLEPYLIPDNFKGSRNAS